MEQRGVLATSDHEQRSEAVHSSLQINHTQRETEQIDQIILAKNVESAGHIAVEGGVISNGSAAVDVKPLIIRHITVGGKQFNIVVDERGIPSIAPLGFTNVIQELQTMEPGTEKHIEVPPPAMSTGPEQPLYVNARQYARILKRRQQRAKLEAQGKIPKHRQKYMYESRHRHALNRQRGVGGRFSSPTGQSPKVTPRRPIKSTLKIVEEPRPMRHILPAVPLSTSNAGSTDIQITSASQLLAGSAQNNLSVSISAPTQTTMTTPFMLVNNGWVGGDNFQLSSVKTSNSPPPAQQIATSSFAAQPIVAAQQIATPAVAVAMANPSEDSHLQAQEQSPRYVLVKDGNNNFRFTSMKTSPNQAAQSEANQQVAATYVTISKVETT